MPFGRAVHDCRFGLPLRAIALLFTIGQAALLAELPPLEQAQWIWGDLSAARCELRQVLRLNTAATNASILITADNGYELYVNGSRVGGESGAASEIWQSVERYDIGSRLARGPNVIGIRGIDLGGVRGVIAAARIELKDGSVLQLVTDESWHSSAEGNPVDYSHPEFVESPTWPRATSVGVWGMPPWGKVAWSSRISTARNTPRTDLLKPAKDFRWPGRVAFLGEDCSVYVPLRADAWGVCFRVDEWSRAYTEFDLPCPSKIGRKLYSLQPGLAAKPALLFDAGAGVIGTPSATFTGEAVLACMALGGEKFFHIYRIPLDGQKPRRLTDGPFHDLDPAELPDGRIVFASTRIGTFEEYHNPPSRALFVMNTDGSGIHPITFTPIFDNEPKVTADGRIAFVRSDNFFDRGKVETHLHVIRPDGTDGLTEVGAAVGPDYGVRLRAFGYGSPAPLPGGKLAYISNRGNGIAFPGAPESEAQRVPGQLGDVAPLPDGRLLCTVLRTTNNQPTTDCLAVYDPASRQLINIYDSPMGAVHSPFSLMARERPAVIPDYVEPALADAPGATGFLLCQNARLTTKTKAGWDHIKAIRVLSAAGLTLRSSHSHIVHAGHETVELGTVPLAPDGSFFVEVPANTPIALQAVDAEGRSELNEMSWIYVRPGERRACVGCHQPRKNAPVSGTQLLALRAPPVRLLGQGQPHRSRGNNAGVTGMMDLQFERFRECASLNLHEHEDEWAHLARQLKSGPEDLRISSAQRLGILRDVRAASALIECLAGENRELRVAAALALASCGNLQSLDPLRRALADADPATCDAAAIALENLTGHAGQPELDRTARAELWTKWLRTNTPATMKEALIARIGGAQPDRPAIAALGHLGSAPDAAALRQAVASWTQHTPYPPFINDNRTDTFTFGDASSLNPRGLQEAVRALGRLADSGSIPLLEKLLASNIAPRTGNLYLAEAVIEALGNIGGPKAERILLQTFAGLRPYWEYVGWYSDHPALYACHSSPLHSRIIQALDKLGSANAAAIIPELISSIPTDPDRALFANNDDYETLAGRLIRASGSANDVIETCLFLLGDPKGKCNSKYQAALSSTHPAWAGHPGPENRSAQVLSLVCRDSAFETRAREAYARFLNKPEEPIQRMLGNPSWTPIRHWVLFYLGRTLGHLHSSDSVQLLASVLKDDLNEARHGRPEPSEPEIHFLQMEYTPCWRASAAWALGKIGDPAASKALLRAVENLDNATDVRHTAARALGELRGAELLPPLRKLASNYPEVSTRRALEASVLKISQAAKQQRFARRDTE